MARRIMSKEEKLYLIVNRLRAEPKMSSKNKQHYNFSDPTALRALKIHRHLKALEEEILDQSTSEKYTITIKRDAGTDRIIIEIRNNEVHCSRVAFLSQQEFTFLRKNRKVANVLRKCRAWRDVA
jgi:hypothetical protein